MDEKLTVGRGLSRRGFLKVAAGAAAAGAVASSAANGPLGLDAWREKAFAEDGKQIIASCACCSNGCPLRATVKNGRLASVEAIPEDTTSGGRLCNKGNLWTQIAYATEGRVLHPSKRRKDGSFETISWDQALNEIAEKLHKVIDANGPQSVALCGGNGNVQGFYATRFINALGSPNSYAVTGACKVSHDTGWNMAVGAVPSTDLKNADYVVLIGRSPANGIYPTQLDTITRNRTEKGAYYVSVDPRYNNTIPVLDEWVPIKPATDLAFLLGIAHVLVSEDLYDHEFVENYTTGLEEWIGELEKYTPQWAESVSGVPADTTVRIARGLAAAKHGVIEHGFRGGLGVCYGNNVQTTRVIALVDALLGAYGKGGITISSSSVALGKLADTQFENPKPQGKVWGAERFPNIPNPSSYLTSSLLFGAESGDLKALFYVGTNPVMAHGNPSKTVERLGNLDLLVTIDVRWSETAGISDYVLPDVTYLEHNRGLKLSGSYVYEINQVIEPVNPDTRSAEEIFRGLAKAYGVGQYFEFSKEDRKKAELAPLGVTAEELAEKGFVKVNAPAPAAASDTVTVSKKNDNKILFADDLFAGVGLGRVAGWQPPFVEPKEGEFRLISGNQPNEAHTYTALSPHLRQITLENHLERIWINAARAKELGIEEGDDIELVSEHAVTPAVAHVTQAIHPDALFTGSHYGNRQSQLGEAGGYGVAYLDHAGTELDPISGSQLSQENAITVRKVVA